MKRVILPLGAVAAVCLSASSFATAQNATQLNERVDQLTAQTQTLQQEVAQLRKALKKKKHHHHHHDHFQHVNAPETTESPVVAPVVDRTAKPWHHFVTVTTTPFLGKKMDFDGDDLIFNLSSINEDLTLLTQRQSIENEMAAEGFKIDRPILQVSGGVEGQFYSTGGFGTKSTDGMNLSDAQLDLNAIASSWASAFMTMNFNGSPISTGNREPNSTVYIGRGFVTIGNLNVTPIYFTGGLMYVPFGRYSNLMVTTPLTQSLARIRVPAALLGFKLNNGLFGSVYGFTGNQTSGGSDMFKQGGVNAGIREAFGEKNSYSVAAGWVSNIADAQGEQNNGIGANGAQFGGFGVATAASANNNLLVHRVDGVDLHGHLTVGDLNFIGEYVGAAERYSPLDLQYNGNGAEPGAAHGEVDYTLPFFPKKYGTNVGFAYDQTWEALALNLPENSYTVFLNTSLWRETLESIEFRHDTDYSAASTATGRGALPGAAGAITGTGKGRDSVTAQFGVYF